MHRHGSSHRRIEAINQGYPKFRMCVRQAESPQLVLLFLLVSAVAASSIHAERVYDAIGDHRCFSIQHRQGGGCRSGMFEQAHVGTLELLKCFPDGGVSAVTEPLSRSDRLLCRMHAQRLARTW